MKISTTLLEQREFADIDRQFAKFIGSFGDSPLAMVAAAALSRNIRAGHICLDLADHSIEELLPGLTWPDLKEWEAALANNAAVGGAGDHRPLVLDEAGRLYLRRYWEYEQSLAKAILKRCEGSPAVAAADDDLHQLAIETALARRFMVISGGPGTGKTTTVLKILERMVAHSGGVHLRIALAAPTGKAAARLEESLRGGSEEALRERLPKSASTLHRLLGSRSGGEFRHHSKNPLPVDVLVVDEASMVPLTMMAKVFDALPEKARVILLGDPYQLASVEPGYVLGDIAGAASASGSPLHGSLVELQKNYRFGNRSAIFALSEAVRSGDADRVFGILDAGHHADLTAVITPPPAQFLQELHPRIVAGYSACLSEQDPATALKKFLQFRVLCALRSGPMGVESVNAKIESILREEGLISGDHAYRGLPVLITRNDYELGLFNGDTGMFFPDDAGTMQAWFLDEEGGLRHFAPARLPDFEPAFAMTVHKSQGSEYDEVLLLLPERQSPVCTRELVYTGLTRARNKVELWFREPVLRAAIASPIQRSSGLREQLGGGVE